MARHPRFLFHGRSGREDFRSASLSSADERAQFPRVGRRGKKLERSTRVCRLRRPCTSDRSGQCQRCRSPPPPKSKSSSPPPPSNLCRGSSNRRAKTRAESAWRVARSWHVLEPGPQESVTISGEISRAIGIFITSRVYLRKLRRWIFLSKIFLRRRYDLSLLLFYRADSPFSASVRVINSTRDYIVTENILERELFIL